jgi:hypothetical protein
MKTNRRTFLRLLLGGALTLASGYFLKSALWLPRLSSNEKETLSAFLDALIPEDETPGALSFGVPADIKRKTETDRDYRRMVKKGCEWLDQEAARSFGKSAFDLLGQGDRDSVIAKMSQADHNSLHWLFFYHIRRDAFFYYYGHPETWKAISYKGPPQPVGFRDYYKAPQRSGL